MATVEVKIQLNSSDTDVTISPSSPSVSSLNDSVVWRVWMDGVATEDPWLVFFDDGDAVEVKPAAGPRNAAAEHSVEVRPGFMAVPTGKKKGSVDYKVATHHGNQIYAVLRCPSIIIK